MSEPEEHKLEIQPAEERRASPLAGCLIFAILLTVFVSLGGFIAYTYLANKSETKKISEVEKKAVTVADYVPAHLESLQAKLQVFSDAVKNKENCSISITVQDLNIGIAKLPKMVEFKEKMYITAITPKGIEADISFPVKSGFTSDNRYINGTMVMQPEIAQGSIFPIITSISPDTQAEVLPRIKQFLPQALFSSYRTDPDLKAVFHKLSEVKLSDGVLTVFSDPDFQPADDNKNYGGGDNFFIALSIVGILFFVFFSSGILIYYIAKKSKEKKARLATERLSQIQEDENDRDQS